MADDAETDEDEDEEGGGGKKKIIMIVGVLAVAGAAYNFVLKPAPPPDEMAIVDEEEPMEEEIVEGEILELDEMILNITGEEGQRVFLRIGLAIVLDELTMSADFEKESAIAKDVAIQYLSSLNQDDLSNAEGREKAKEELSMLIREAYGDEKVSRVLFTALVMQ